MPPVWVSSHRWTEWSPPPIEGSRCGTIQLVAGQISGGWESAEETTAMASAQVAMRAAIMAARLRITVADIRRSCRRGVRDPGPTEYQATTAPAAQLPAAG